MIGDNDVLYLAKEHQVRYRVLFPGGIGYCSFGIPDTVRTVGELLKFLENTGNFTLKEEVDRPAGFRGLLKRILRD